MFEIHLTHLYKTFTKCQLLSQTFEDSKTNKQANIFLWRKNKKHKTKQNKNLVRDEEKESDNKHG